MKFIFILFLGSSLSNTLSAQRGEEWTEQENTQLKYLLLQIAALKEYAQEVEKGYTIAKDGLTLIHAIKQRDFDLHQNSFSSLRKVNPLLGRWPQIERVFLLQKKIRQNLENLDKVLFGSTFFTKEDRSYALPVMNHLERSMAQLSNELEGLLSDDYWSLKDDERLSRIRSACKEVENSYASSQVLLQDLLFLDRQRRSTKNDIDHLKGLTGVK